MPYRCCLDFSSFLLLRFAHLRVWVWVQVLLHQCLLLSGFLRTLFRSPFILPSLFNLGEFIPLLSEHDSRDQAINDGYKLWSMGPDLTNGQDEQLPLIQDQERKTVDFFDDS